MTVTVDILDGQERKVTLVLPIAVIRSEIDSRLRKLAKTLKMHGFRPGKVPVSVVAQHHGQAVQREVLAENLSQAWTSAVQNTGLRVVGHPDLRESADTTSGALVFDAFFEIYPDIQIRDLASADLVKLSTEVTDSAIDKTLDILRRQNCTFVPRSPDDGADLGNRLTVDFEGKINGEVFAGSTAKAYQFILGEGQMLKEFEDATVGMKIGESKTFPLTFPEQYPSKDAAGKMADFMVTVTHIDSVHLPELDDTLIKSLGIDDPSIAGLRANIQKNLEREVQFRLLARHKSAVFDVLLDRTEFVPPKRLVQAEINYLRELTRAHLEKQGVQNVDQVVLADDAFRSQAERTVRLHLIVSDLTRAHQLQASAEQVKAHIDAIAASYDQPEELSQWYFSDKQRLAEVETFVRDRNVTEYVLSVARLTEQHISFDEIMAQN